MRVGGVFSGIAEEVVLAIALGKPVYVLGGCGGAARDVGLLLGLGETIVNENECLAEEGEIAPQSESASFARSFSVPKHPELPSTVAAVRAVLVGSLRRYR